MGSSIVADATGEVREDVLAHDLRRGRRAPRAGDEVVLVTSRRDRARDAADGPAGAPGARWTSCRPPRAVGQGKLYRTYDELLAARGVPSAQVLLTFFDMSARDPLPQRAPDAAQAARLGRRAGDQRERHDDHRRDLVRRQRLPRRPGGDPARRRAARAADRHGRALHAPTRARPDGRAGRRDHRLRAARGARHRRLDVAARLGRACARRSSPPRWRPRPASR